MVMDKIPVSVDGQNYGVWVFKDEPRKAVSDANEVKRYGTHLASSSEILMLANKGVYTSVAISEEVCVKNAAGQRKVYVTHGFPLLRRGQFANLQLSGADLVKAAYESGVPILSPAQFAQMTSSQLLELRVPYQTMVEFDVEQVRQTQRSGSLETLLRIPYIQARLGPSSAVEDFIQRMRTSTKMTGGIGVKIPLIDYVAFDGLADGAVFINSLNLHSDFLIECSHQDGQITLLALDDYTQKPEQKDGIFHRATTRVFSDLKSAWSNSIDALARAWSSTWSDALAAMPPGDEYPRAQSPQPIQPRSELEQKVKVDAFLDTFADSLSKAKCILCHDELSSLPNECLFLERNQSRFVHGGCYQESPKDGPRALQGEVLHVTYHQLFAAAQVLRNSPIRELSPPEFFGQLANLETLLAKYRLQKKYQQALKK